MTMSASINTTPGSANSAPWWAGWAIFAFVAALLLTVHTSWVVLTNDEGIILDAAQRMSQGQLPYLDFFGYMSPGSYWLQTLVFDLFGVSLFTARLPVILDFAAQCGLLFSLTARLATPKTAAVTTLAFFGFLVADPTLLTAQHRWDSATMTLGALYLLISSMDSIATTRAMGATVLHSSQTRRLIFAGLLLAASTWATPSMILVMGAVAVVLLIQPTWRTPACWTGAGYIAGGLAGLAILAYQGILSGLIEQILWLQQHYASVNIMPYGAVIGGYRRLVDGTNFLELSIQSILAAAIALPAILPPLGVSLWAWLLWRAKTNSAKLIPDGLPGTTQIFVLIAATLALVLTTFPRADVAHLIWVVAIPYALAGAGIAWAFPQRISGYVGLATLLLAALFGSNYATQWSKTEPVQTAVGPAHAEPNIAPRINALTDQVDPGDSLFVYPYMPVLYFLTGTRNPTDFSYLAPGMMTRAEEQRALRQLQSAPPEWVMYLDLTEQEFHRVFPNAPASGWKFSQLEEWIQAGYQPVAEPVSIGGYQLLHRTATSAKTEHHSK